MRRHGVNVHGGARHMIEQRFARQAVIAFRVVTGNLAVVTPQDGHARPRHAVSMWRAEQSITSARRSTAREAQRTSSPRRHRTSDDVDGRGRGLRAKRLELSYDNNHG